MWPRPAVGLAASVEFVLQLGEDLPPLGCHGGVAVQVNSCALVLLHGSRDSPDRVSVRLGISGSYKLVKRSGEACRSR